MLSSRTVPAYLASLTVLAVLTGVLLAPSAQAGGKKADAAKAAPAAAPAPATTATGTPRSAYRFTVKDFPVASSIVYPGWVGYQTGLNSAVCDMLTTEMSKLGWDMVERDRLGDVLGEQDLGGGGRLDPTTAAPIGKILGADYLILGTITEWGIKDRTLGGGGLLGGMFGGVGYHETIARVKIDYHVVNAKTSRIVKGSAGTAQGEDSNKGLALQNNWYNSINFSDSEWTSSQIGKATRKCVQQIASQLSGWTPNDGGAEPDRPALQAAILAVMSPTDFIIDKGQADDVRVGDTVDVFSTTDTKDASGKVVYQDETKVGSAKVISVKGGRAKLHLLDRDPSMPKLKEGDSVHTPAPAAAAAPVTAATAP